MRTLITISLLFFELFLPKKVLSQSELSKSSSQPRISSQFFDHSQVGKIYLRPGLSSIIHFPCDIDEVKVGLKSSLEVEISKTLKVELILSAKSHASPTNLFVRCGKRMFVFDVIPHSFLHQDVIQILGGVKSPLFKNEPSSSSHDTLKNKKLLTHNTLQKLELKASKNKIKKEQQ